MDSLRELFRLDRDIEHRGAFDAGDGDLLESLVLEVRQVGIAAFSAVEGHHKAVGEAVVKLLFVFVVGTAGDVQKAVDFSLHRPHCVEALRDLLVSDACLELKHPEVFDLTHGLLLAVRTFYVHAADAPKSMQNPHREERGIVEYSPI